MIVERWTLSAEPLSGQDGVRTRHNGLYLQLLRRIYFMPNILSNHVPSTNLQIDGTCRTKGASIARSKVDHSTWTSSGTSSRHRVIDSAYNSSYNILPWLFSYNKVILSMSLISASGFCFISRVSYVNLSTSLKSLLRWGKPAHRPIFMIAGAVFLAVWRWDAPLVFDLLRYVMCGSYT